MPIPQDQVDDHERNARLDVAEADLAGVEVALDRLDAGRYASCERCGGAIDEHRLADRPTVRVCSDCDTG